MVHFSKVKPILEDQDIRSKLEEIASEDIFKNLSEGEFNKAQGWYKSLRKEERLNLNGVLTILSGIRLADDSYHEYSSVNPDFALVGAGSSISSADYSDIDLFLLPRELSSRTVRPITLKDHAPLINPFESDNFNYTGLRAILAPFNCFYGDETCGYGDERPAAFEASKFGKELTLFILQEMKDKEHDFRKRRKDFDDDFLYTPTGAEGMMRFNREQESKFLVLLRSYKPNKNEGLTLYECLKREQCNLYQGGALKPEVQKYMCDGIGRNVPEKLIAENKSQQCPLA